MLRIGREMRRIRTERGVTHRELALACGVTEGTISRIETDKAEPGAGLMAKIADYLGVTMDELRSDRPESNGPSELERQLIEVAKRVQNGDATALPEMRRLAAALAESESAAASGSAALKNPVARRKGT